MNSSTDTRTTRPSPPGSSAALAFVVPWFGPEARGGAELQGFETARAMADRGCEVEILTTCSRSFLHRWDDNYHPTGKSSVNGLTVRRFPVDRRDEEAFARANAVLLSGLTPTRQQQEDFVGQNINSGGLCDFIRERGEEYLFVFLPYLYGTSLTGALIHPERSLLMPCFHIEPYAYLTATRRLFREVKGIIYLAPEEKEAVERVMPEPAPGVVVGGGIDTDQDGDGERFRRETGIEDPYMVYVGRLDRGKNTHLLVSYFRQWVSREGREMKLVLIGGGDISLVPEGDPSVVYLGTPDEQLKMDAVAGASLLCQPSVNESFSRVIMEAWLCRVPVMVSADCPVTAGHCRRSGGGLYFGDYFEFAEGLEMLAADPDLGGRMGEAGRRYVLENYHWDRVTARFAEAAADLTGISPAWNSGGEVT